MYEFGAYGLPGRFSHWTHGKAYQQIKTMYDYGLSKIYELVINTNPCLRLPAGEQLGPPEQAGRRPRPGHSTSSSTTPTSRTPTAAMLETVSINAERLRQYEFEHGREAVETLLDAVLSIQEHIDPNPRLRKRRGAARSRDEATAAPSHAVRRPVAAGRGRGAPSRRTAAQVPGRAGEGPAAVPGRACAGPGATGSATCCTSCGPSSSTSCRRCRRRS